MCAWALQHYRVARQTRKAIESNDGSQTKSIPANDRCDTDQRRHFPMKALL